jgi:hypothetical protein
MFGRQRKAMISLERRCHLSNTARHYVPVEYKVNNVERNAHNIQRPTSFIPMMRTPSSKVTLIHSGESGFELEIGLKVTSFSSWSVSYETGASDKKVRDLTQHNYMSVRKEDVDRRQQVNSQE